MLLRRFDRGQGPETVAERLRKLETDLSGIFPEGEDFRYRDKKTVKQCGGKSILTTR